MTFCGFGLAAMGNSATIDTRALDGIDELSVERPLPDPHGDHRGSFWICAA